MPRTWLARVSKDEAAPHASRRIAAQPSSWRRLVPGGAAMLLSMRGRRTFSGCRRDADIDAVVAHLNDDPSQAGFWVAAVAGRVAVGIPGPPKAEEGVLLGGTQ